MQNTRRKKLLNNIFGFWTHSLEMDEWEWILLGQTRNVGLATKSSHSRVSQCWASIRKLGNRRSSEGLRSFKPSKGTNLFILIILAKDIETNPGFNVAFAKNIARPQNQTMDLGIVQTAKQCAFLEARFRSMASIVHKILNFKNQKK